MFDDASVLLNTLSLLHVNAFKTLVRRNHRRSLFFPAIKMISRFCLNTFSPLQCSQLIFLFLLHQAFVHVVPLRDYFLEEQNYINIKLKPGNIIGLLAQRFGELNRKMWNPRNFKAHVSPHEMLQSVVLCSKKRFQITEQGMD